MARIFEIAICKFEIDIDFQVKAGVLVVKKRFLSYREKYFYTSKGSANIVPSIFLNLATNFGDLGYSCSVPKVIA